ncbi:MAG TPA: metal ABC transporter ATP-binding protein [Anaerolineales bacterium]|nr:metal ABC transporter ATP-binding protein [Anaerolineales bacterium]
MPQSAIRPAEHDRQAPSLQVQDLSVRFNGTEALRGVSFDVPAGGRLAVVGPNGAGKTTLFKVIAGILPPAAGSVRIFGHAPGGDTCLAYVPQRSQIDLTFPVTAAEVVLMGRIREIGMLRWPRRKDWQVALSALERVGLADAASRQIGDLSGGQQQRVFLAQALAQEAELVLLDEPFTGLDFPSLDALFAILDELQAAGVTEIISTHDLNLAADRFSQVLLINRRLIAVGAPAQVLTQPNLVAAYGGHVHRLPEGQGMLIVTDTCCEGEEEAP